MGNQDAIRVRANAVAGMFYPDDGAVLSRYVAGLVEGARAAADPAARAPKALIVPHAGYVYSGPVAASAYARLHPLRQRVQRVVLLGPSHRVALRGMAVPSADAFETPLGRVLLDRPAIDALVAGKLVRESDAPHAMDHALEVQLPFLQVQLENFRLLPIAVGACPPQAVANVLDALWGGGETLIVVSTDLSHFHGYDQARAIDRSTCQAILQRDSSLSGEQACGCHALNGLMLCARRRALEVELLDLRNSGDTAGDRSRVVGYGSFAVHEHRSDH